MAETIARRARFRVGGYAPDQMLRIAKLTRDDIEQRILRAEDYNDSPAPALKNGSKGRGYAFYKAKKAPPAIRNWRFTGQTLRAMQALDVVRNRAKIGFVGFRANKLALFNNRRHKQFAVSPRNRQVLIAAVRRVRYVRAQAA